MRLPILFSTVLLAASLLPGQEKQDALEAVIIPVKTLSGDSFNRLIKMLGVFNARFSSDDKLRTIVVYAPKDVVSQMRRVIEQLDQPGSEAAIGRNIDMTLSFLRCFTTEQANASPLPADLEAVGKQLRAATQYKSIQLWDVVPLRLQEGKTTEQNLRLPGNPAIPNASSLGFLRISPEAVRRTDAGRYVRFEQLQFDFKIPQATGVFQAGPEGKGISPLVSTQFTYFNVGLKTAGDFKEGQKTVLGKISGIDNESAIFVVISLKILD